MSDPIDLHDLTDYTASSVRTMYNSSGKLVFAPHNLMKSSEDFASSDWTKTATTVTSNAAMAPDGTLTADKISHTSTTADLTQQYADGKTGATYRAGIFVKNVDANFIRLYLDGESVWFDLSDGSVGTDNTSEGATTTALSDGWYYLEAGTSNQTTAFTFFVSLHASDNTGTEETGTSAYIWGAHLYENGLGGMADVPEDERALPALTKYVPNKAVTIGSNLVSNGTFDADSGWTKGTGWSIGSGVATASAGSASFLQQDLVDTITSGSVFKVEFEVSGHSGTTIIPHIRGTVGPSFTGNGSFSCYIEAGSGTSYGVAFYKSSTFTGNIDNITVTKVDRDPSAARFLPRRNGYIYKNGSWVRGLTWESEARTNLFPDNDDLSSSTSGTTAATGDLTYGLQFYTLTRDLTGFTRIAGNNALSLTSGTTYTLSGFFKVGNQSEARLACFDDADNDPVVTAEWDLVAGTKSLDNNTNMGAVDQRDAIDLGNGVYYCVVSFTPTETTTYRAGAAEASGTTTNTIQAAGLQLEAGSTPSSLIPTYGATRTRTAETLKDKADKIVWPNTTYVTGTELVTNGTFDTDLTGWTDGSEATGSVAVVSGVAELTNGGSANDEGLIYQTFTTVSGGVYQLELDRPSGNLIAQLGTAGAGSSNIYQSPNGTGSISKTFVALSASTTVTLRNFSNTGVSKADNISVKEINPRAKCVVMHGYMTYADEGVFGEAVPYRIHVDSSNNITANLSTSLGTGEFDFFQISGGVVGTVYGTTSQYSPGINVPFKIASRHLDNAIQGAADGTATTENTTPPGLPDLSSTQTEWFYDFMGHVTDVLVYAEDIEEAGLTTLTARTLP